MTPILIVTGIATTMMFCLFFILPNIDQWMEKKPATPKRRPAEAPATNRSSNEAAV